MRLLPDFHLPDSLITHDISVRDYHGKYYVPQNFTLIVGGKLASGTESLLKVVQDKVEPIIIAHKQNRGPRPKGWKRPFLETPSVIRPPFTKTVKEVVEFPEQDETVGEVHFGFVGPDPQDLTTSAVSITIRRTIHIMSNQFCPGTRHAWHIHD